MGCCGRFDETPDVLPQHNASMNESRTLLRVFVPGTAETKGSARAFVPKGWNRAVITNDNKKAKPWQAAITYFVRAAFAGPPIDSAVCVDATFYFQRPKHHFGAKGLRASAPTRHTQKPDKDKCERVVLDALTGVVYRDDAQVCDGRVRKEWSDDGRGPGVEITVTCE